MRDREPLRVEEQELRDGDQPRALKQKLRNRRQDVGGTTHPEESLGKVKSK